MESYRYMDLAEYLPMLNDQTVIIIKTVLTFVTYWVMIADERALKYLLSHKEFVKSF